MNWIKCELRIKCLWHAIKFASKRNKEPVGFTIKSLSAHNKVPYWERIKVPAGTRSLLRKQSKKDFISLTPNNFAFRTSHFAFM